LRPLIGHHRERHDNEQPFQGEQNTPPNWELNKKTPLKIGEA
jgi:hypothetical protein